MTTQQEIETLYKRLEELDKQAFLNFVETQEIVSRLKELGGFLMISGAKSEHSCCKR